MVTALGTPDWIKYGWVNVSRPFDLMDLSWSLLLDLNGGSLQDGMSVMQDPIQGCHEYLRNHRCIVVIDGLRSTEKWDLIKAVLELGTTQHCVVVITGEESVAKYGRGSRPPRCRATGPPGAGVQIFTVENYRKPPAALQPGDQVPAARQRGGRGIYM